MKFLQKQSLGVEAQGAVATTEVILNKDNVNGFLRELNTPGSGCEVNLSPAEVRQLEDAKYGEQGYMAPFQKGALDRIISKKYPGVNEADLTITVLAVEDRGAATLMPRIDSPNDSQYFGNSFGVNKNDFASFVIASASSQKR